MDRRSDRTSWSASDATALNCGVLSPGAPLSQRCPVIRSRRRGATEAWSDRVRARGPRAHTERYACAFFMASGGLCDPVRLDWIGSLVRIPPGTYFTSAVLGTGPATGHRSRRQERYP